MRASLGSRSHRTSSQLADVEVSRVARRAGPEAAERARRVIASLALIPLADGVLDAARTLEPASLRALDAIHIASALSLGAQLQAMITYDVRMLEGAASLGLQVFAPS